MPKNLTLIIKNEYGDVVYQQEFNDKNFDKKVLLTKNRAKPILRLSSKRASAVKAVFRHQHHHKNRRRCGCKKCKIKIYCVSENPAACGRIFLLL